MHTLTDIISDGNGDIGVIVINIRVSAIINVKEDIVADMKVSLAEQY